MPTDANTCRAILSSKPGKDRDRFEQFGFGTPARRENRFEPYLLSSGIITLAVAAAAVLGASSAVADDAHYVAPGNVLWNQFPGSQWTNLSPGAGDRAIFDQPGTGSTFVVLSTRDIGQLVFLAPYTGSGLVSASPASATGIVRIGGIDGLGVISRANHEITLSDRIALAGNQEWQIDSLGGSIRQLSNMAPASRSLNLGAFTLTLNPVQGGNAFYLNNPISGTGALAITGAGKVYLNAVNSYSGGTFLNGGQLVVSADAQLGAGSGALNFNGGELEITGTGFTSTARAITFGPNGGAFDIVDPAASFTLNQALSGSGSLAKRGSGTLSITVTNSISGAVVIESGTLSLSGAGSFANAAVVRSDGLFDISAAAGGTSIKSLSGAGNVSLGAGTLTLSAAADTFGGTITGTGGVALLAGTEILAGTNSYSGATTLSGGKLVVNGSIANSSVTVLSGATLAGSGIVGSTAAQAGGIVAPGNSIGTLTINGNYIGNGGRLDIEAALAGDASPSDRLVVTGSTTGSTLVTVRNLGGAGAKTVEGIKIVDVGGASNGSFALQGDYLFQGKPAVVGGAYAYQLEKNGISTPGDGDWYLRSTFMGPASSAPQTLYQAGVPIYEAYGQILQSLNGLPTLRQRVGERCDGSAEASCPFGSRAIWARIEGARSRITPRFSTSGTSYDIDSWRMQAGIDGQLLANATGMLVGSVTTHHGEASADITSLFGRGKIDTNATGFGGALTWYGQDGFYADAQTQLSWFDSDLSSTTASRQLAKGKPGFGYALGLEIGQRFGIGESGWSLTPQAQLVYARVDADSFVDPFGAHVSLSDGDSLRARIGFAADYRLSWRDSTGQRVSTSLYGVANLSYEFLDGATSTVSGTPLSSREERLWGDLGLGAKYEWDRYAVYGEVNARTSLAQFGDSHAIGGKAGFRVSW